MAGPIEKWKMKGIDIAAWPTRNNGTSFTLRKTYKDKQTGEWKDSKYWFREDLEALKNLCEQALAWAHRSPEVSPLSAAAAIPLKERQPSLIQDDEDIPF